MKKLFALPFMTVFICAALNAACAFAASEAPAGYYFVDSLKLSFAVPESFPLPHETVTSPSCSVVGIDLDRWRTNKLQLQYDFWNADHFAKLSEEKIKGMFWMDMGEIKITRGVMLGCEAAFVDVKNNSSSYYLVFVKYGEDLIIINGEYDNNEETLKTYKNIIATLSVKDDVKRFPKSDEKYLELDTKRRQ